MRGQAEIIILVGFIIVAVVVILLAFQQSQPPPLTTILPEAVKQKENLIRQQIQRFAEERGREALETYKKQGGFANGSDFWFKNGTKNIPSFEKHFEGILKKEIDRSSSLLRSAVREPVTFGNLAIKRALLESNKITLDMELQTIFERVYLLDSNYRMVIPTEAGRIYEFAKRLAEEEERERFLEYHLLYHMALFDEGNGSRIPFTIFITECGVELNVTWEDVAPWMGKATENASRNVTEVIVERQNLRSYADLEPSSGFDFIRDKNNFDFTPEPIFIETPAEFSAVCISDPVEVEYTVRVPLELKVKDTIARGEDFVFSLEIFIEMNEPGGGA